MKETNLLMGQVSHGWEYTESAEKAGDGVDDDHDEGVPENGTMELVVGAEGNQATEGDPDGVEDLGSRIHPHLEYIQKDNEECDEFRERIEKLQDFDNFFDNPQNWNLGGIAPRVFFLAKCSITE